jgi:hypothetical protein
VLGAGDGPAAPGPGGDVRQTLEKVDAMIAAGRRLGYHLAADNLQRWRDSGGDVVLPGDAFRSEPFLLEHLRLRHRPRFLAGARRRFHDRELTPGGVVTMEWTDSVYSPYGTDLYFALGGFTVHSKVVVGVGEGPGPVYPLTFRSWEMNISDRYDWDPGKWTLIPGFGRVSDNELLSLERAGHGRAFAVKSETITISDPTVTAPDTVP